ncbi:MAG: hypothetical protein EP343_08340 [Deltaproteobacteria bacterium]|nr:MAG: hypothetical protein EP343_08340 [Deltaproteobacteria bacterium]
MAVTVWKQAALLVMIGLFFGSTTVCAEPTPNDWGVGFSVGGGYTVGSGAVAELPSLELRYYTAPNVFMDMQLAAPLIIGANSRITAPFQFGWSFNGQVGSRHVQFFGGVGFAFTLWSTPIEPLPLLQFLFPVRLGLQVFNSARTIAFQLRVSPAFAVQAYSRRTENPSYEPFPTFQILGEMVLLFYLSRSS